MAVMPNLRNFTRLFATFSSGMRGAVDRLARLQGLAMASIAQHQKSASDRMDMLTLCQSLKENHPEYTDQEIVMESFDAV